MLSWIFYYLDWHDFWCILWLKIIFSKLTKLVDKWISFWKSIFLSLKFVPSPISRIPYDDCISFGIDLENVVFEVAPFFSDFKLFFILFRLFL